MKNIVDKNQPCHPTWPYSTEKIEAAKKENATAEHPVLQYCTQVYLGRIADVFRIQAQLTREPETKRRCERMEAEVLAWIDLNRDWLRQQMEEARAKARS